jgi:hypothetical protein
VRWTALGAISAFAGCAMPVADGTTDPGTTDQASVAEAVVPVNSYRAAVTGSVEIKEKIFFTSTLAKPAIINGSVTLGPLPARCQTGSNGIQTCQYTMSWQSVTVNPFTVEGKTVRNLQVSTLAPVPISVAQGKFTVPANTARFVLTGTINNAFFYAERTLDSAMSGTFDPNGRFTIAGTASRTIPVGPLSARVWGNFNFGGQVTTPPPACKSVGGGQFICEPGGVPAGSCRPVKLHRTVIPCKGASKSDEQIIDLVATGYSNFTCANRFNEQCIDDGSFDAYYSEWCEYSCP